MDSEDDRVKRVASKKGAAEVCRQDGGATREPLGVGNAIVAVVSIADVAPQALLAHVAATAPVTRVVHPPSAVLAFRRESEADIAEARVRQLLAGVAPKLREVGEAMQQVARQCTRLVDRNERFGALVQAVLTMFHDDSLPPTQGLAVLGRRSGWPSWACDCANSVSSRSASTRPGDGALTFVSESLEGTRTEAQAVVLPWLARPDWREQFWLLLQGIGLPTVVGRAPYQLLLDGLPGEPNRSVAGLVLARRIARLLNDAPEVNQPAKVRCFQDALGNLLQLAAALENAHELGPALRLMLERRKLAGRGGTGDLRHTLLSALIVNQPDDDLLPLWQTLLTGLPAFLPGSPEEGFSGILRLPLLDGQPAWRDLAWALARMAQHCDNAYAGDERRRDEAFERLLGSIATHLHPHRVSRALREQESWRACPPWALARLSCWEA